MPAFFIASNTFVPPPTFAPAPSSLFTPRFRTLLMSFIVEKPSPIEYVSATCFISSVFSSNPFSTSLMISSLLISAAFFLDSSKTDALPPFPSSNTANRIPTVPWSIPTNINLSFKKKGLPKKYLKAAFLFLKETVLVEV